MPATIKAGKFPRVWVPATWELEAMGILAGLESGDADATHGDVGRIDALRGARSGQDRAASRRPFAYQVTSDW